MSQQLNPLKGFRYPWDILVEMSRRTLDMGLELRREILAGFGCYPCTTVINVMGLEKVNQGSVIEKSKPKAAKIQEESRGIQAICSYSWFCFFHIGEPLLGTILDLIRMQCSECP